MHDAHTLSLAIGHSTFRVVVLTERYMHGGRLAVQLVEQATGEFVATVSVNVPDVRLADDEFVFKTYSENEGIIEQLLAAGFVQMTGRDADIGPICRLLKSGGAMEEYL